MPIRTYNNIDIYIYANWNTINIAALPSTLPANKTNKWYSVLQNTINILKIQKPINKKFRATISRARSADAVQAIF